MTVSFIPPRSEPDAAAPADVLRCRYRYATGCTTEYANQPAMYQHEKKSGVHADHRIDLKTCPECGVSSGDEMARAQHLSAEHGIRARSERRQELDALQVKQLYVARYSAGPDDSAADESPVLPAPSPNGHAPAPLDLAAAQGAFAALVAEVEMLRAENAALKAEAATFAQVRNLLSP
jgi:hypothetical protein